MPPLRSQWPRSEAAESLRVLRARPRHVAYSLGGTAPPEGSAAAPGSLGPAIRCLSALMDAGISRPSLEGGKNGVLFLHYLDGEFAVFLREPRDAEGGGK